MNEEEFQKLYKEFVDAGEAEAARKEFNASKRGACTYDLDNIIAQAFWTYGSFLSWLSRRDDVCF